MRAPRSILILGGGTAGWVCAAVLAKSARRHGTAVTVVDTAQIPTIGVGEASIPTIYDLLRHVEVSDETLVAQAQATFKYGIRFENWSRPDARYMHGFGNVGTSLDRTEFFSAWLGAARNFTNRSLTPFTPAAAAAEQGRFSRVALRPEGAPSHLYFPLSNLSYALHFDASLLARILKETALGSGAVHLARNVVEVETDEQGITALRTSDGGRLTADFFVDCSGLGGLLSRRTFGASFDDWSQYLPCDRAIAVQSSRASDPNLYTRSVAHPAGWRWEIQLQDRTGNGTVYCSDCISDDEALHRLLGDIQGEPITEPRRIPFRTGRLAQPWQKNCAAIGLSAGFLEPLESTSIHLICKYALMLAELLYSGGTDAAARDRFNRAWREETDEIRDFLMAHYVVNQRSDPFWQARREGPKPESLNERLEEFRRSGWLRLPERALFGHDSWFQILIGQEMQLDYERLAVPRAEAPGLLRFLENVGAAVAAEVRKIPCTHQEFLAQIRSKRVASD